MHRLPHFVFFVAAVVATAGCSSEPGPAAASPDVGLDVGDATRVEVSPSCVSLYGTPGERTGLSDEQCGPSCGCDQVVARAIDDAEIDGWLSWTLDPPATELTEDPYATPAPDPTGSSCFMSFDSAAGTYALNSRDAAASGEVLTHGGACGVCSTLQDLVAYVRNPDLTGPVRECGLLGIREGEEANLSCLQDLGFSPACAQVWYYNTKNTRTACLAPCFEALNAPYHLEDGSLNACLECDEVNSGPVFKAIAGRTRRNSGLASAICRPCDSVTAVSHEYPVR